MCLAQTLVISYAYRHGLNGQNGEKRS
jgi:hypothetical protein